MNLSSGYPLWLIRNGIPYDYPRLQRNARAEVVVMGGGISGAFTAYCLQKAGIHTMLVDGRTLGLGSTCASTSLLQYEIDIPLNELIKLIGEKKARRAYELSIDTIGQLEAVAREIGFYGIQPVKSIYYAANAKHLPRLEREFEARKQMGIKIRSLDGSQLEKDYGVIAPGAILSEPAAQTDAYGFTHALHQHNIKKGVAVYDRTLVTGTRQHKQGVTLFTAGGQKIECRTLVHATGYETVETIDRKIVTLGSTYAVSSDQAGVKPRLARKGVLLWSTARPYLYVRTTADNRIIAGGRDESFSGAAKRDALIAGKSRQLAKDFRKLVPGTEFNPEFSWAGTFGSTPDGLPVIGRYQGLPRSLFALGFGGNGITFSVLAAEMITGIIRGAADANLSLFSFDRL